MKLIIDLEYRGVRVDAQLLDVPQHPTSPQTLNVKIDAAVDAVIGPDRIAATIRTMAKNTMQAQRVLHTDSYLPIQKPRHPESNT